MTLHVLLDEDVNIGLSDDDIVLVSPTNRKVYSQQILLDENIISDSQTIYYEINDWFSGIDSLYSSLRNRAYVKFFKPVLQTLAFIDKLLSGNQISEIVLYGGARYPFMVTIGGEGEGKKVNYKTNWLVNYFIEKRYNNKYRVVWKDRKPIMFFRLFSFLRNLHELGEIFLKETKRALQPSWHKHTHSHLSNRTYAVITDLPLQYNHLSEVLSKINKNQCHFEYFHLTYSRAVAQSSPETIYIGGVKAKDCFRAIFRHLPSLPRKSSLKEMPDFLSSSIRREFKYMYYELFFREKRLYRTLKKMGIKSNCNILTDMTAGHIVAIRDVAKELGLFHYNIQHVSMSPILYPDIELADRFYLYSEQTYKLYSQFSKSYYPYFPIESNTAVVNTNDFITLSVFCQPDAYTQDYLNYISQLLSLVDSYEGKSKIQIIVKPHYRQDRMDEFKAIIEKYTFANLANKEDKCSDIIKKSTLCMSISSSVIFESMSLSKPCIIYNPDSKYDYDVFESGVCYPDVNFVTTKAKDSLEMMQNITLVLAEFKSKFESFIEKNGLITDWSSLIGL